PIRTELAKDTPSQGAVMDTSPASVPFRIMVRSGFPIISHEVAVERRQPEAAAMKVLTSMREMASGSAAMVLPGLKPNHPNHKMNVPRVARLILWPGIGITVPSSLYLPRRAPRK